MKPRLTVIVCLGALLLLITACMTEPISGKRELVLTSESEENQLGAQAYDQVLQKEKRSHNQEYVDVVQRVASRIAKVANHPEYDWQFTVLDSPEENAFCLPGGKIAVYTGILPVAANEAGLATVLGHEVAHATARHAGQRLTRASLAQLGLSALSLIIGGEDTTQKKLLMGALGLGFEFGENLPFSREQEADADAIGMVYMAEAGYDPAEAPRFWRRFSQQHPGGHLPVFFSDHPSDESRMKALQKELPRAEGYYRRAPQHFGLGQTISG